MLSSDSEELGGVLDRFLGSYLLTIKCRRAATQAHDDNARQNDRILKQLKSYRDEIQRNRFSLSETSSHDDGTTSQTDSLVAFRFMKSVSVPEPWKSVLKTELFFIQSGNEFQNAYELYARLPFFWFWGQKALILSTSLRKMRTSWPNFQILNGSLNFCNLVPMESDIVRACRRGDVIAVRDLFREHKTSPNDMSVDDKGLLWVCYRTDRDLESMLNQLVRYRKRIY